MMQKNCFAITYLIIQATLNTNYIDSRYYISVCLNKNGPLTIKPGIVAKKRSIRAAPQSFWCRLYRTQKQGHET